MKIEDPNLQTPITIWIALLLKFFVFMVKRGVSYSSHYSDNSDYFIIILKGNL